MIHYPFAGTTETPPALQRIFAEVHAMDRAYKAQRDLDARNEKADTTQKRVLELAATGMTLPEIQDALGCSASTVRTYLRRAGK